MVEPLVFNKEKATPSRGWVQDDKISNALIGTKVLAKSKQFDAGDVVYVRASDVSSHAAVKNIFEFDSQKCIILPEMFVVLVDRK
jgi:hypothetical protein